MDVERAAPVENLLSCGVDACSCFACILNMDKSSRTTEMSTDLYVHVYALSSGENDDIVCTLRLPFKPNERCCDLLQRCASDPGVAADPPRTAPLVALLAAGAYTISPDGTVPWGATTMGDVHPLSDVFAIAAPPVDVYVHGTASLSTVDPSWVEKSVRLSVDNGRMRFKDVLDAFTAGGSPGSGSACAVAVGTEEAAPLTDDRLTAPLSQISAGTDFFIVKKRTTVAQRQKANPSIRKNLSIASMTPSVEETLSIDEVAVLIQDARRSNTQRRGLELCRRILARPGQSAYDRFRLLSLVADLQQDGKKLVAAASTLAEALDVPGSDIAPKMRRNTSKRIGILLYDAKEFKDAATAFTRFMDEAQGSDVSEAELKEVKIRLGGCLYMLGEADQGVAIVQGTLGGDLDNNLGVYWMTRFYAGRGLVKDAVSWAVQLVVRSHNDPVFNPQAKELLALVMQQFGSERCLAEINSIVQVPPEPNADLASVVGYLAIVARDHSIMDLSIALYRRALDIYHSPLMALNYIHTLENDGRVFEALVETKKCLEKLGPIAVGSVSCRHVAGLIGDLTGASEVYPVPPSTALQRLKRPRKYVRVDATTEDVLLFHDPKDALPVAKGTLKTMYGSDAAQSSAAGSVQYSDMQVELLGLFFAAVKDLFVLGFLDRLPDLVAALSPLRHRAALHKTNMRNESAYFCTIMLLLQHLDPCVTDAYPDEMPALYVVGDSHTLPLSWHTAALSGGKQALMACGVATGVKIWHLRDSSDFYPKHVFDCIMRALPRNADVMFVLGEIDCREGVLQTVEKGMYNSILEVCEVLARIYLGVVQRYRRAKQMSTVLLHPPPPSLDPTRPLVKQLTDELAMYFAQCEGIRFMRLPLLTPDGNHLLPQYHLDSTHLSPQYVLDGCLQRGMDAAAT